MRTRPFGQTIDSSGPIGAFKASIRAGGAINTRDIRIHAFDDLSKAGDDWRAMERKEAVSFYQTHHWATTWARTNQSSGNGDYRVYIGYLGAKPVALAAFEIEDRGWARVATPIGGIHAARCGTLLAREILDAANSHEIVANIGQTMRANLAVDAILMPHMSKVVASREATMGGVTFIGPSPDPTYIADLDSWDIFERSRRTAKQRSNDRRNTKPLNRHGEVVFQMIDDAGERNALLDLMLDWKSRQFVENGIHDRYCAPDTHAFYRQLAEPTADSRPLIGALKVGGETAAIIFAIGSRDMIYGLVTAISPDPKFRRGSPGLLAFEQFVKIACEETEYASIDFGIGGNPVKDRWCNRFETMKFRCEAHSIRGGLVCSIEVAREVVKRFMRAFPSLTRRYYAYRQAKAMRDAADCGTAQAGHAADASS